jgi:hypothetical protein|tara:strand:+ start:4836 stop:5255 length:420 start_codon:yes stop_codon:yes gene_type:complete
MNIELLEQALVNEDNYNIAKTTSQEIKNKKNDILQKLQLNKDNIKLYHKKLRDYIYVETIKDLKYGANIRWINLKQFENIKITNGGILCHIKANNNGISLVIKLYNNHFINVIFNENLIFQLLNQEEKVILKAFTLLSK